MVDSVGIDMHIAIFIIVKFSTSNTFYAISVQLIYQTKCVTM